MERNEWRSPGEERHRTPRTLDVYLGQRVALMRRAQKMTRTTLAKQLGVSSWAMGLYENGELGFSARQLVSISRILEIDLNSLVGDSGQVGETAPQTLPDDTAAYLGVVSKIASIKDDQARSAVMAFIMSLSAPRLGTRRKAKQ